MKKAVATLLSPLAVATFAIAQPNFNVSVDGYDALTDVYGVQVEWMKSEDFSILLKPYALSKSESGVDWSGYGVELAGRMYNDEGKGFYKQAGIDLGYVKAELGSYSDDTIYLGFNFKVGYRWVFADHFTVDAGIGIGAYTSSINYGTDDYRDLDGVEGFGIVSVGYGF